MKALKARLDRLDQIRGNCPTCCGSPRHIAISYCFHGEPTPPFPDRNGPTRCECGRPLERWHIVHRLRADAVGALA